MINKNASVIITALILFITSACQPQVELEPAPHALETTLPAAVASHTITIDTIITAAILEPVTPSPETQASKEILMPVEPSETPPAPAEEEAIQPTSSKQTPIPDLPSAMQKWVAEAREDLALRQSISSDQIELFSWELKEWPNAGLGCPQPGMGYAQVTVEGYLIRLRIDDQIYNYHGGGNRSPFLCLQPGPKIMITKQAPLNIKQTPTKSIPPPRD